MPYAKTSLGTQLPQERSILLHIQDIVLWQKTKEVDTHIQKVYNSAFYVFFFRKLNVQGHVDTIALKISINRWQLFCISFSLKWSHILGANTDITASQTLCIRHCFLIGKLLTRNIFSRPTFGKWTVFRSILRIHYSSHIGFEIL